MILMRGAKLAEPNKRHCISPPRETSSHTHHLCLVMPIPGMPLTLMPPPPLSDEGLGDAANTLYHRKVQNDNNLAESEAGCGRICNKDLRIQDVASRSMSQKA